MLKRIIITADDLGIAPEINMGIMESYQHGLLSSAALLMNAPYTHEGIALALQNPGMETGIHLSIVEGISLRGKKSSITEPVGYFGDCCLIRNWKEFMKKYTLGRIDFKELEEELELQILEFLKHFPEIPFLNGTQHLHLLPKVWNLVIKLAVKYRIKAIRTPSLEIPTRLWLNSRLPFIIPFQVLGQYAKVNARKNGIKTPDGVIGLQFSGKISEDVLLNILKYIPENKTTEIVMHPGYDCPGLREKLPGEYSSFNWNIERLALLSVEVKEYMSLNNIQLSKFSVL
jgi:chitin disaccharide deacetylase